MSSREHVLANIRARLTGAAETPETVAARLRDHPAGPVPAAGRGDADTLRAVFVDRARAAAAEVVELDDLAGLPPLVAGLRAEYACPPRIPADADPVFDALDWAGAGVTLEHRPATGDDRMAVSLAFCGVAEAGTVVLCSDANSPITLAFLPDVHVVALDAGLLVGSFEEVWQLVRDAGAMPRSLNWVTGPSRSADIEQTLHLGAHGPVRLIIALVRGR